VLTSNNITEARGGSPGPEARMPTYKAGKRDRAPTHPGAVVRSALAALGVTVYQAAPAIGMTRAGLGKVVNEQGPVTTDSALLLSKYLGNGPGGAELLLGMQMDFDLWHARKRLAARLASIKAASRPASGK
jgi:addiction module HigA family antidote